MRESELTGKRVELIRMEDPYTNLKPGDKGTIRGEDDMNHILVSWDNGSSLNLIRDVDEYKIEESSKIRRFYEFISSDSYLDAKLTELEEMVKSFTDGKDLMYHWENKNDESVVITFQFDGVALKYDFDIDEGYLTKTTDDQIEFEEMVESTEEGLEIIEKDIQLMFGISESLDLNSLYDIKKNLERRIDDYFGGDKVYHGDQGYQDLLSDLEDIESQIEEVESGDVSEKVNSQAKNSGKINRYKAIKRMSDDK